MADGRWPTQIDWTRAAEFVTRGQLGRAQVEEACPSRSVGGGDSGGAERADGGIAYGSHDLGLGANLAVKSVVGDVPRPVNLVLEGPDGL